MVIWIFVAAVVAGLAFVAFKAWTGYPNPARRPERVLALRECPCCGGRFGAEAVQAAAAVPPNRRAITCPRCGILSQWTAGGVRAGAEIDVERCGSMEFPCEACGGSHRLSELSLQADRPFQWDMLSDEEREKSRLGQEQCIIIRANDPHFFLRACLRIPIRGTGNVLIWNVWVSLGERDSKEITANWKNPDRVFQGPYFAWLSTRIPGYPDTIFLKAVLRNREPGLRPLAELEPTDHPLIVHQRQGVEQDEVARMIAEAVHEKDPKEDAPAS